jgi:phenylacetate-CoA ligase
MLKFKIKPELDYSDKKKLERFYIEKLKKVINYAYKNSRFYYNFFKKNKINPEKIKTIKDFQKIPFTYKEDLRKNNFDFIAVEKEKWVDVFSTTGTTGERIYFPITSSDLSRTAYAEYRCLKIAGVKESDIVQFTYPMSTAMWGAGISYYLGYQLIGCCVLRYGPGAVEEQLENMRKLSATIVHAQAGFLARLGEIAWEKKIMKKLKVRLILPAIENLLNEDLTRNELGKKLEEIWKYARLCAVYGNTESAAPLKECEYKSGYHITPEFCYYEIVNPETNEILPPGEKGVIVITPLDVEGLPLIRYYLGDISFLIEEKCKCKRSAPRLGPILGRVDEMMKIKGVVVYPQAIENILKSLKEIGDYYIEIYRENYLDKLRIYISLKEGEKEIVERINNLLKAKLNISGEIFIKSEKEIQEKISSTSAKIKRVFDLRK